MSESCPFCGAELRVVNINISRITSERDELRAWREDHLRAMVVADEHFIEARKLVSHLWEYWDQPGIKLICQALLDATKQRDELKDRVKSLEQQIDDLSDAAIDGNEANDL